MKGNALCGIFKHSFSLKEYLVSSICWTFLKTLKGHEGTCKEQVDKLYYKNQAPLTYRDCKNVGMET